MGKPFTEPEAVLLLDAYLKVQEGVISRAKAVKTCSEDLRRMAIRAGMEIDDSFRHPAGIASQMEAMESAFQGWEKKRPPTRLFKQIVNLYHNEPERYRALLNEAKVMAKPYSTNEELFMSWLSAKVPDYLRSTFFITLTENVERMAKGCGEVRSSLYDEIDLPKLGRIRAYINGARSYQLLFKRERERIQEALDYLETYLREKAEEREARRNRTVLPEAPTAVPRQVETVAPTASDLREDAETGAGEAGETGVSRRAVDFTALDASGVPADAEGLTLDYFGEMKAAKSWRDLFVDALVLLRKDYWLAFAIMRSESIHGRGKSWLVDEERLYRLESAALIAEDYYVDLTPTPLELMKRLKAVLDRCNVDYENVLVSYAASEQEPEELAESAEGEAALWDSLLENVATAEAEEGEAEEPVEEIEDLSIRGEEIDDLSINNVDEEESEEEFEEAAADDVEEFDPEEEEVDDEEDDDEAEESEEEEPEEGASEESDFIDNFVSDGKGAEAALPDGSFLVDFEAFGDMRFTKPICLKYFEEEPLFEATWKDAFVDACRYLFKDYPSKFLQMRNEALSGSGKPWLVDETRVRRLIDPRDIGVGFYVESNLSVRAFLSRLKSILDRCGVDYDNLTIIYSKRDEAQTAEKTPVRQDAQREERAPVVSRVDRTETTNEDGSYARVNFDNPEAYYFTKPVLLRYYDREVETKTWKDAYVAICRFLYKENPDLFNIMREDCLSARVKPWLAGNGNVREQGISAEIAPGFFVETKLSAYNIIKKLNWLLDECGVDPNNVEILFRRVDGVLGESIQNESTSSAPAPSPYEIKDKATFQRWLAAERGLSEEDVAATIARIGQAENLAAGFGLASTRLFTENVDEAKATADALAANPAFNYFDSGVDRVLRDAISALMDFYACEDVDDEEALEEEEGDVEEEEGAEIDEELEDVEEEEDDVETNWDGARESNEIKSAFRRWLVDERQMSEEYADWLAKIVGRSERFAERHDFSSVRLYTDNLEEAKATAKELFDNREYAQRNHAQTNRFFRAINYLMEFYANGDLSSIDSTSVDNDESEDENLQVARRYIRDDKEAFYRWLVDDEGLSEKAAGQIVGMVNRAERFAQEHGFSFARLFTDDADEAQETARKLFENVEFARRDKTRGGRFRDAIDKLLAFYDNLEEDEDDEEEEVIENDDFEEEEDVENEEDVEEEESEEYDESEETTDDNVATDYSELVKSDAVKKAFHKWMLEDQGMSEQTSYSYVAIVTRAEKYAFWRALSSRRLYVSDPAEAKATINALYRNAEFSQRDRDQDGRFHKALMKLMAFYAAVCAPKNEPIKNESASQTAQPQSRASQPTFAPLRFAYTRDAEGFAKWLTRAKGLMETTSRQIASTIKSAERFAIDRRMSSIWLYTDNLDKAKATANALLANQRFLEYDRAQNNRFSRAIAKLMEFYGVPDLRVSPKIADPVPTSRQAFNPTPTPAPAPRPTSTPSPTSAPTPAPAPRPRFEFVTPDARQKPLFEFPLPLQTRPNPTPAPAPASTPAPASSFRPAPSPAPARSAKSDLDALLEIVAEYGGRGFRINSNIEMGKLLRRFREEKGREFGASPREVVRLLTSRGIVLGDFFFLPDVLLPEESRERILDYIAERFDEGRTAIYYDALLKIFSYELGDSRLHDDRDALRAWLEFYVGDQCGFRSTCLTPDRFAKPDPNAEIRKVLKERAVPMEFVELCAILEHLGAEAIKTAIYQNLEFVKNGKGEFFHADSLELSQMELDGIARLIENEIAERQHLTGAELVELIRVKFPNAYERNEVFSECGWRDAIKYKLEGRFSISGDLIGAAGGEKKFKTGVFADLGLTRRAFTLDELEEFAKGYNVQISFEHLYQNARRVSFDKFVANDELAFNVEETDAFLAGLCPGNYLPFQEITNFAVFPEASHPWNEYLLEQYVAFYSREFEIAHRAYNKSGVAGAIVRKARRYADFNAVLADVLAESGIPLELKDAVDYLYENGYVPTRATSGIEPLLSVAQAKRNQRRGR